MQAQRTKTAKKTKESKSKEKIKQVNHAPKDQFIGTTLTLRKLQKNKTIPSQISPIILKSAQIRHPKPNIGSKYLLISEKNVVYYGQLNAKGYPEANHGIFIYSDGSYFQGQVKNGKPEGEGRITNIQNSYSYTGQWKKGLPDGVGKEIIGNNIYEGEFRLGKKNGKGNLFYGDGSHFEGVFLDNVIQGDGKYFNKNNYWEGNWANGYMEGHGKQIIAKKDIKDEQDIVNSPSKQQHSEYVGNFVKGQKSGNGIFKWNKNYEYDGQFSKGQLNGEGTFKFKGRVYAGVWSNGTEVKISQLRKGLPSVIMTGSINPDGNIVMQNSTINSGSSGSIPVHDPSLRIKNISHQEKGQDMEEYKFKSVVSTTSKRNGF